MIDIYVNDETSALKSVILGIADGFGETPTLNEAYDPKSKEHINQGTYPKQKDISNELTGFLEVLKKYDVKVYRPRVIESCNQVFCRDIGFVIEDKFVRPKILKNRKKEVKGIQSIVDQINPAHVLEVGKGVRMEGGDVMTWYDHIFVGYSKQEDFEKYIVSRTNTAGVNFLKESFPDKIVKAFELNKSDTDAKENALHLDCCFQPIGRDQAIIYKGGFKNEDDYHFLIEYFGKDKIIEITKEEMYDMNSNIFSISDQVLVSDKRFDRLNKILNDRGFIVEAIQYTETAKMEGLLRCSTLPLKRERGQ